VDFGDPERFFGTFFVYNYCPLAFMEASGRNRTPDRLPTAERGPLFLACDAALRRVIESLEPSHILGIGRFAEQRARQVAGREGIRIGRLLHPSPASPAANRGWERSVRSSLRAAGLLPRTHGQSGR
jgi:single-strand selective monofunctional uracil DNA glycosylase